VSECIGILWAECPRLKPITVSEFRETPRKRRCERKREKTRLAEPAAAAYKSLYQAIIRAASTNDGPSGIRGCQVNNHFLAKLFLVLSPGRMGVRVEKKWTSLENDCPFGNTVWMMPL
jgi:hypothetical protein